MGEEDGAIAVEGDPLDDEDLRLLAGLEQAEHLVDERGVAIGEPRRGGALGIVLEHGFLRGVRCGQGMRARTARRAG